METSLKQLRSEIIYDLFQGPKPDDSKLTNDYFDIKIMDARAQAIEAHYKATRQLPPDLFSEFEITISKTTSPDNNISYWATIPTIINILSDKAFRIRGKGDNPLKIEYWEIIPRSRFTKIRKNIHAGKNPKVARVDDKIFFMMKNDIKVAIGEAIVFDPRQLPNFTETSRFPVSPTMINVIKEIIYKMDFSVIKGGKSDNENDSISPLSKQANQESQRE